MKNNIQAFLNLVKERNEHELGQINTYGVCWPEVAIQNTNKLSYWLV